MNTPTPNRTRAQQIQHYREHLASLHAAVHTFLLQLEILLQRPFTPERDMAIATLAQALELANEEAWHFGLGRPLRKKKPLGER